MSRELTMQMYGNRVCGVEVSKYSLKHGYLDYLTLSRIIGDCILNNDIYEYVGARNWTMVSGFDRDDCPYVYSYYIISEQGCRILEERTDEIVYYCEEANLYLWAITHFGTGWDYVLTDIKLIKDGADNE